MPTSFDLPVTYKGQELSFPARLLSTGYTHTFAVSVNGREILFEPDEEQYYRAMVDPNETEKTKAVDVELLAAIAETIREIVT